MSGAPKELPADRGGATRLEVVAMPGPRPLPPRVSAFTRPFWDALADRRLTTVRCTACGGLGFPPRDVCRGCWGRALDWVDLSPLGTLYSFTRVHVVPGAFRADAPYAIGLVDLDDGPRLMCRLVGDVTPSDLDGRVEMVLLRYQDGPLFGARVRDPAHGGAGAPATVGAP